MKKIIILFMVIGSYAGSYTPVLWGGSLLSMSSILFGGVGGFVGIWAGYKIANSMGLD
jgi:hypothetical protein